MYICNAVSKIDKIRKILSYNNLHSTMVKVLQASSTKSVIIATVQSRLFNEGVDSEDEQLRTDFGRSQRTSSGYSIKTEKLKNASHVDLFSTGSMFNSMNAKNTKEGVFVDANLKKEGGSIFDNFQDTYISELDMKDKLFSLSESDIQVVIKEIVLSLFNREIKKQLDAV